MHLRNFLYCKIISLSYLNQIFHYTRRITPKL